MDFKKLFILILSVLFFSPSYSTAMDEVSILLAKKRSIRFNPDPGEICTICSKDYSTNKNYFRFPCQHFIHVQCAKYWCHECGKNWCPVCEAEMSCAFCLQPLYRGKIKLKLTDCKNSHYYHFECLAQANDEKKIRKDADDLALALALNKTSHEILSGNELHPCPGCRSKRIEKLSDEYLNKCINSNKNVNSYDDEMYDEMYDDDVWPDDYEGNY